MVFKVLTLLIIFTGCLSIKDHSQSSKFEDSSTKYPGFKKSLNLTKRTELDIEDLLSKYPNAENITIVSSNRGSVSFNPEELKGGTTVNVIYSNQYSIFITNENQLIKIKRVK